jgi:hypothetical protein
MVEKLKWVTVDGTPETLPEYGRDVFLFSCIGYNNVLRVDTASYLSMRKGDKWAYNDNSPEWTDKHRELLFEALPPESLEWHTYNGDEETLPEIGRAVLLYHDSRFHLTFLIKSEIRTGFQFDEICFIHLYNGLKWAYYCDGDKPIL